MHSNAFTIHFMLLFPVLSRDAHGSYLDVEIPYERV